jgi:hypothetical protein
MLYQLPNGKVVEITFEQYLQLTDEDIEYLVAFNHGEEMDDPFFGSSLFNSVKVQDIPDIPPDDLDLDIEEE